MRLGTSSQWCLKLWLLLNCTSAPVCGNEIREGSEECDAGVKNGVPGSECDDQYHKYSYCGDGIAESSLGETCDLGDLNGKPESDGSNTCLDSCQDERRTVEDLEQDIMLAILIFAASFQNSESREEAIDVKLALVEPVEMRAVFLAFLTFLIGIIERRGRKAVEFERRLLVAGLETLVGGTANIVHVGAAMIHDALPYYLIEVKSSSRITGLRVSIEVMKLLS
ncbi:hypothetical protein B7494_g3115 [Chlorociboria aeruginascens]|nr:hypothetical protein B7494_g3115 [Chlorociboria aeruginascens]